MDIKRLADIYSVAKAPLVLHGGSGLTDEDFKNTVRNGIRKVNICTEMCIAAQEAYKNGNSLENAIPNAVNAVKEVVSSKIMLFESNNRV